MEYKSRKQNVLDVLKNSKQYKWIRRLGGDMKKILQIVKWELKQAKRNLCSVKRFKKTTNRPEMEYKMGEIERGKKEQKKGHENHEWTNKRHEIIKTGLE